jgi:tetratricopeptide (TPR) repeat protein
MRYVIQIACLIVLVLPMVCLAADERPTINWASTDVNGADVKIPIPDRTSVVAFVRVQQEQSKDAIAKIQSVLGGNSKPPAQVVIVLSGPTATDGAKELLNSFPKGWAVVADAEFAASGTMGIHVWPTTLVVKSNGTQVAHIGGMPKSFTTDLRAYLDYAAGQLDDAGLQKQLTTEDVVTDSPTQIASRHVQVAQRMIEQGHVQEAQIEVSEALKKSPQDTMLLLMQARVLVLLDKPKDAIEILDKISTGSAPAWQASLIRGRALIALSKWAEAKTVLPEALKLNPDPAEAHYLLGLCYQHDQDWQHATDEFRQAFEKSPGAKRLTVQKQ